MRTFEHKTIAVDIDGVILDSMQGKFDRAAYNPLNFKDFPTMDGCIEVLPKVDKSGICYYFVYCKNKHRLGWK